MELNELPLSPDVKRLNRIGGVVKKNSTTANKYHVATKPNRTLNGRTYASKKEMLYAQQLNMRVKAGEIDFYLEQVPFRLPGNSVHRLDFMTFKQVAYKVPLWEIHYVETKGRDLPMGKLKRKMVEDIYKITVELV